MFLITILSITSVNNFFNETKYSVLPKKQTLSFMQPQWYQVSINSYNDIKKIKSKLPNLTISPLEIKGNHLSLFLTPNEARTINKILNITVYTKKPSKTTFSMNTEKNDTFIVYAHSSFRAPRYTKTISQHGPFYFISTNQPSMIENDPTVLSVKKVPHFHTMNRWTTGFLQSGENDYTIKNDFYQSNRKYNERGLNGSNVIVTLIDTGAEVNNCLFNDPNYPTPYNVTNLNHRKIIRYDPFVDRYDKVIGHGTHCAGIIAGSTESFPLSLYNGNAPGSKLYIADIGSDETGQIDVSFTFDIFKQSQKLNSPIISCSWGQSEADAEFTQMFDYLSYENPYQLFVFAAGNDYNTYTIGAPADSKNVLTVASSLPPRGYYLNSRYASSITLIDNNEFVKVTSNNVVSIMDKRGVSYIRNIELTTFNENIQGKEYSKKAVIVDKANVQDYNLTKIINFLANNNAKAALIFDENYINNNQIIVINVNLNDKSFFDKHHRIDIKIYVMENVRGMTVASYSSKGPTILGNRKPDIMAPGTSILSASNKENSNECNVRSSLVEKSGTSMATPAVSGSLALIYQYLKESIHGLPYDKSKEITSALLRAFAVAGSGDKANIKEGFGNLNLSRILIYPNLDFGKGLRFCSDKINHNKFISYFIKTDHIGSLSATIAWIDVPVNLESLFPLFSFFEFYIIGPDRQIYETNEQFSTNKKIVINDAPVGTYEIRIRMNQIAESDYNVDYSVVVVGPFDQLNFIENPSELKPSITKSCSSKCPVNQGYAKCDIETSACICDKKHTGTHCEFEISELQENEHVNHQMINRDFFYVHIDLSQYREKKQSENLFFVLHVENRRNEWSTGLVRYFFNADNKSPLSIPNYFIQYKDNVFSTMKIPLSDLLQMDDVYLTVFNDYGINISFILSWSVEESSSLLNKYNIEKVESKFTQNNTHKIILLSLIFVGCIAIVSIIVFLIIKTINNKKNKRNNINEYQQYTDAGLNNKINITLIDNA